MSNSRISIIVALTSEGVIGNNGRLPWPQIKEDMKFFKDTTMGHPVVMGRKTWESIPEKFRPLTGRSNLILSWDTGFKAEGAHVFSSLDEALESARNLPGGEEVFIIGGGQLYQEALSRVNRLYLTYVSGSFMGDTRFEYNPKEFVVVSSEERNDTSPPIKFLVLDRK